MWTNHFIFHTLEESRENLGKASLRGSLIDDIFTGQINIVTASVEETKFSHTKLKDEHDPT